ncbi:uncharacterized protein [Lolium perenne]|uniref:uncharacterized protein isoform X1 n=1 Tax=Lolium perenne TaxID=4522 RepID=UPI003A99E747
MSSSPTLKPWTAPALPLPRWHACPRRRPCPAGLDAPGRRSVPCWPGRPRCHLAGAYTKAAPPTRGLVASANSTAWTQPPLFLDVTPTCSVRGHLWHEAPPSPHQSPRAYTKSSTKILNRSLNNSQRRQAVPKTSSLPQEARRNGEMKEIQNILADKSCMVVDPCFFFPRNHQESCCSLQDNLINQVLLLRSNGQLLRKKIISEEGSLD